MALHHSPRIVTNGLVLALDAASIRSYPMSGTTWYDLSGNNKNFAINMTTQPTFLENSLQFQNQGGYRANVLSADILTDMTIECWYKPISMNNACCGTVFGTGQFQFFHIGNYVYMMIGVDNGSGTRLWMHPQFFLENNIWHHVVLCRRNKQYYVIWVDGVEVYISEAYSGLNLWTNKDDWYVSETTHPNVKISSCRAYNRALSSTEILQNYNATKSKYGL